MGTLFECLKEARLEKYYPTFRVNGITRSEALARLDPADYDAIGIESSEDRRRLGELISIIKSVHASELTPHSSAVRSEVIRGRKSPRKRNRSPIIRGQDLSNRALSVVSDVRVRENIPQPQNRVSPVDLVEFISSSEDSDDSRSNSSSGHSDYEPASKHINAATESPTPVRKTLVNRVKTKGYNYGVPNPSVSSSISRSRSRPISASRQGGEEKIKVCVRKRPLNRREVKSGETDIASAISTTTLTIKEPKQAVDLTAYTLEHEFIFDEVFDENCSNEDVYIRAARPLINCLFDGGSATCFAYGQTGAGKTHTMIGSRDVPGLYLLASQDIYSIINTGKYGQDVKVWVSYFEIYCGQLFDLLNKRNRLHAREDGSHKVCIAGLTETHAKDVNSLLQVLEYGNTARSKGATGVNPDSSRSHAILQMEIRDSADKRLGRISFIDLAGSERASDVTDTDRQTRMEGAEINQSLLALKECIRSIDQESKHKPFRQSKLTHILKDSFVGNSRTCMIANISPTQSTCEHTLNTLRYADRVKELRREAAPPGSKNSSAAAHMLMNIPPTAPNAFQPGNILCSSTPIKPRASRYTAGRSPVRDIQLDPNETPIKGHGVKRKTVTKNASNVSKPQIRKPSASVASRLSLIRHTASSGVSYATQLGGERSDGIKSNNERITPVDDSSSDHTESDSCNVPEPKPTNFKSSFNAPIVKSTDTENDFATTDFNNEDEMNDLNRTDGKGNTASVSVSAPALSSGVKLSTSGHPLPVVGEHPESPKSSQGILTPTAKSHFLRGSHGMPPLRQKIYTDETERKSPVPAGQDCSIPERRELLKHSPPNQKLEHSKKENSSHTGLAQRRDKPVSRLIAEHYEIIKKKMPSNTPSKGSETTPKVSLQQSNVTSSKQSVVVAESFEDDLLFEDSTMPFAKSQKIPRTPSNSDLTSPLGLSRGNNGPLKLPQDPSLDLVLPAVMTAKSSDLTTFSQRSPRRFFKEPEPPPPPFSLALVNTSESRPRVVHTPPPQQNNFKSQFNQQESNTEFDARYRLPPPYSQPDGEYSAKDAKPDNIVCSGAQRNYLSDEQTDSNVSGYNKLTSDALHQGQTSGYVLYSPTSKNREKSFREVKNVQGENEPPKPRLAFMKEISSENTKSSQQDDFNNIGTPENPLSTNEWYNTPANLDYHIVSSVQKSTNDFHNNLSNDSKFTNIDPNLPDFLPIQKRQTIEDKTGSSRQDVASRLRSVFFKDTGSKAINRAQSNVSDSNNSDSGIDHGNTISSRSNSSSNVMHQKNQESDLQLEKVGRMHSPPNRDFPDPNQSHQKSAIRTEMLDSGSAFSPVHPQPVTSVKINKGPLTRDQPILRLREMSLGPDSQTSSNVNPDQHVDTRQRLISAHEEQLASVTSLCKQEMKLLLGAKAGHKTYDEYMEKVSTILNQKMAVIQRLQEEIENYRTEHNNNIS